jgi:ABC-type dipeptide/oligopeptide/nickel transport system permease subunit
MVASSLGLPAMMAFVAFVALMARMMGRVVVMVMLGWVHMAEVARHGQPLPLQRLEWAGQTVH